MIGPKSFRNGLASLLATLFCLLAATNVCIAAPYHDALTVRDEGHLSARAPTPEVLEFKKRFEAAEQFYTDESRFIDFTEKKLHRLGSGSFGGCVGIVLATKKGAVVGHFVQDTSSIQKAAKEIPDLYKEHSDKVSGAAPHIYAMISTETEELVDPDVVNAHVKMVEDLTGQSATIHHYIEPTEAMVDQDGDLIEDADMENLQSGALLLENEGGGDSNTNLIFVDPDLIKASVAPPS
ncbi:hypothetical protein NM208_g7363 [Fusarium decemcellulare]|uniref:Uncharacterized protein n=2 Tax=Fusarium decemcellulare TaxID=57161 RepID=A0ACC1S9L6_9HYPO|nr:hypothetical protein NM208_g8066 [Fusarium decemcellulare]KAJ3534878.1 hypothetical protein NM208_g7363 [Fusarium decemcellulare]